MKPHNLYACLWTFLLLFQATGVQADTLLSPKDKVAAFKLAEQNSQIIKKQLKKLEQVQKTFRTEFNHVERSAKSLEYFTENLEYMAKTVGSGDAWIRKMTSLNNQYNQQARATFTAMESYSQAADQALNAIDHYASSGDNEDQAVKDYTQAQMRSNKKLLNKQLTVEAVTSLADSKKQMIATLSKLSPFHHRTLRELQYLLKTYKSASTICLLVLNTIKSNQTSFYENESTQCQLIDKIKDQTQSLLAHEQMRWQQTAPLLEKIEDQLGDSYDLINTYHRQTVARSISRESQLFLQALNRVDPKDKMIKAELQLSAKKLASLDSGITLKKEQFRAEINDRTSRMYFLGQLKAPLPEISSSDLRTSSEQVANSLQVLSTTLHQQVEAQRQAFDESVEVADTAYFAAYGEYRLKPGLVAQAEAQLSFASEPQASMAMEGSRDWVNEHVYARIYEIDKEPDGYGSYTYVLFTHEYSRIEREEVKERYRALLEAIARSTDYYDQTLSTTPIIRKNIFCIPTQDGFDRYGKLIDGYHTELARSFISTAGSGTLLTKEVIGKFNRSPGPFLLTTQKRLSDGDAAPDQKLIFTDLSSYSPDTYDSILHAYKTNLEGRESKNSEIWEPDLAHKIIFLAGKVTDLIPQLKNAIGNLVGTQNADGA